MFAMLLNVVLRLILYVDIAIGQQYAASSKEYGVTINSTKIVCESLYILLEYLKTVAYVFSFVEGFHLHNTIVVSVFYSTEPKLSNYSAFGWVATNVQRILIKFQSDLCISTCTNMLINLTKYTINEMQEKLKTLRLDE
uniref:Uncharacterized protein n=1 Tax=Romanomermis culicivorax TaxID=13658 RepID=A0A915K3Y6_ROMCU